MKLHKGFIVRHNIQSIQWQTTSHCSGFYRIQHEHYQFSVTWS